MLSNSQRAEPVLLGRNGIGFRHRYDRTCCSGLLFPVPARADSRNDADNRQRREVLKIVNRSEGRVVLLQDEGHYEPQAEARGQSHQHQARALWTERRGRHSGRLRDREDDTGFGGSQSFHQLGVQLFVE